MNPISTMVTGIFAQLIPVRSFLLLFVCVTCPVAFACDAARMSASFWLFSMIFSSRYGLSFAGAIACTPFLDASVL